MSLTRQKIKCLLQDLKDKLLSAEGGYVNRGQVEKILNKEMESVAAQIGHDEVDDGKKSL